MSRPDTWAIWQRLAFIEFQLEVIGFINRDDLTDAFGISTQQASADLKRHQTKSSTRLAYNLNRKRYEIATPQAQDTEVKK